MEMPEAGYEKTKAPEARSVAQFLKVPEQFYRLPFPVHQGINGVFNVNRIVLLECTGLFPYFVERVIGSR